MQRPATPSARRGSCDPAEVGGMNRCTLVVPPLPKLGETGLVYPREPGTRPGSRSDRSSTVKRPLEWPTQ